MAVAHWLFKTEPSEFSIDDLERASGRTTSWDGIRNAEARNHLRDRVRLGDLGFLYHSGSERAIVGVVGVVTPPRPDRSAFRRGSPGYDAKSDPKAPTWWSVDLKLMRRLARPVTLEQVKREPELAGMVLVKKGRLSVQPVAAAEWKRVLELAATG